MQSAAVIAQQYKEQAAGEASEGEDVLPVTAPGASIEKDGKTYIHGNPFKTTPEIVCSNCRLPRLRYPVAGRNAREPDAGREYCARRPCIEKEGCDIYGKSLDLEKPNRNPKGAKDNKKKVDESPDGSQSNSPPAAKASDKPTSIPSGKCPNCPRYMAVTRIAQHMDRCMGISGRQSSKNAMSKMNTGTPRESRATTPKPPPPPPNAKKRKAEKGSDEDSDEDTPKKAKKKKLISKKQKDAVKAVNNPLARVKSGEKRLPGQSDSGKGETLSKVKGEEE